MLNVVFWRKTFLFGNFYFEFNPKFFMLTSFDGMSLLSSFGLEYYGGYFHFEADRPGLCY